MTAQPAALRTSAVRTVERKHARRDFRQTDTAVDTGKILTEHQQFTANNLHIDNPLPDIKRRFQRIGKTLLHAVLHDKAVDNDFNRMLFVFLQIYLLIDIHDIAVNAHADIAFLAYLLQNFFVFTLFTAHNLRHNQKLRALRQRHNGVNHLVNCLLRNRLAAFRTVRMTGTRK